ncbi:MAG: pyruvate kinase [Candidatus Micrarchaeota archaeon]
MKKTKIVCTIGPASISPTILKEMCEAGMNCARINTAHGDFAQYSRIIRNVRSVCNVPILMDIKGPEVRVLVKSPMKVKQGELFKGGFGKNDHVSFTYDFHKEAHPGDELYIANGKVRARIISLGEEGVILEATNDGVIEDRKSVNIPEREMNIPSLSRKDKKSIEFAIKNKVEFIALSFVRGREDVLNLRKHLSEERIAVISKIENLQGVNNLDSILGESDGVMIARGDLGVEIPHEKIPLIQKEIIRKCNQRGRISITATQMLESMIFAPAPTRAETSDVANAILDGSDAVMLSGETATGKYPVGAVRTMSKIAREVESSVPNRVQMTGYFNISDTISKSIHYIAGIMPLDKIIPITRSGYTARMIARFRLQVPIIAVTDDPITAGQLELIYGVLPVKISKVPQTKRILKVAEYLYGLRLLEKEETVLFTAGVRTSQKHASNLIEIHKAAELLKFSTLPKKRKKHR